MGNFCNRKYSQIQKSNVLANTVWREIFVGQNFCGYHGFASDCENFNRENFTHNANHTLFSSKLFESLASVCVMAMYCYFSSVDKLPHPTGSLPMKIPSSSIVLANAGVKSMLKSLLAKGKGLCQAVT